MSATLTYWRCETCTSPLCHAKILVANGLALLIEGARWCAIRVLTSICQAHEARRA